MASQPTREIRVETAPRSRVHLGPPIGFQLSETGPIHLIVVDQRVSQLYGQSLASLGDVPTVVLPRGEVSKSFAELERVLGACAEAGLDRHSRLLAFGGGVTSDLTGLAAALYMRGIDFACAPTTLLAQVDASVGGKTAINLSQGKNLAGCFHQPSEVFIDTRLLTTLDEHEWRSGLGEVLKAAVLGARVDDGAPLFDWLESTSDLDARDPETAATMVAACVRFKADVVAADFTERGPREQLNLGHTFAHAIEHTAGFGVVPHGTAVAAGIAMALEMAAREDILTDKDLPARTAALAQRLGLPTNLADIEAQLGAPLDPAQMLAATALDKKSKAGTPRYILPRAIGDWTVHPA